MSNIAPLAKGVCPVCGEPTLIRNTRSAKPEFCSKICESNARFTRRYTGTSARRDERPKTTDLSKWGK